jgi:phytoene dehydrogenase-like protein
MTAPAHYDVAIIGAGLSGLAAGIRLAHFGRRVCIFERHTAVGGLNSFYSLAGRKYDVGLHAVTNYVPPGTKGTPLGKLLRQLRIAREEFDLCPQRQSRVTFGPRGDVSLRFTNEFAVLETEIARAFPTQIDGFRRLVAALPPYDDAARPAPFVSARAMVRRHVTDPLLTDMIFCVLMYYGGAQEHDMDFVQFGVMFRSVFLEGLARPFEGMRRILRVLTEKYRAAGGERHMRCGVARIVARAGRAAALQLDDGTEITAGEVISSIGAEETARLLAPAADATEAPAAGGRLSFVESVRTMNVAPEAMGWGGDTIVFFNDSERFDYARPDEAVDIRSGVICFPNNFDFGGRMLPEGALRLTCLANYDGWVRLPEDRYRAEKGRWLEAGTGSARPFLAAVTDDALAAATVATDVFTPRTITRFTGHLGGAVYGAPDKTRDGQTALANLHLCGTDQGLLGIVGSMLSGIAAANRQLLQAGAGS